MFRYNRSDDILYHIAVNLLFIDVVSMLGGDHDRIHAHRSPTIVLYRHLTFTIRTQIGHRATAAPRFTSDLRQLTCQLVSQTDRHRHQFGRLVTGKTNHHALVAGTYMLQFIFAQYDMLVLALQRARHTHINIRRLLADGCYNTTSAIIKAIVGTDIS